MMQIDAGLSSVVPRFSRWITSLGVDPADISSYHSQTQFRLDFEGGGRVDIALEADGTIYLVCKCMALATVNEKGLAVVLSLFEGMLLRGVLIDTTQICIKDDFICLMLVQSVDQTRNAKTVISSLAAAADALAEYSQLLTS